MNELDKKRLEKAIETLRESVITKINTVDNVTRTLNLHIGMIVSSVSRNFWEYTWSADGSGQITVTIPVETFEEVEPLLTELEDYFEEVFISKEVVTNFSATYEMEIAQGVFLRIIAFSLKAVEEVRKFACP